MVKTQLKLFQEIYREVKEKQGEHTSLSDVELKTEVMRIKEEWEEYLRLFPIFCPQHQGSSPFACKIPISCRTYIRNPSLGMSLRQREVTE